MMFTFRPSAGGSVRRTVCGMRENFPDPYLAQTGFDADAETADDLDDDEFEFGDSDEMNVDDELDIEEQRARER